MENIRNTLIQALERSYCALSPYSEKQRWEFDSNLFHLHSIVGHISKADRIIDVGCGIGILALALKILGYNVCGIDKNVFEPNNSYSIKTLDNLKKIWNKENIQIDSEDVFNSKINKHFDVVLSIAVIEHQKNLKGFIESLFKYADNDGVIYIATPNVSNFLNRFRMFFGRAPMSNLEFFFKEGEEFKGHWREYTVNELMQIAKLCNAEIIEVGNRQTTLPHFTSNYKKWHINIARIGGQLFPGTGDANYIWMKK